MFAWLRKRIIRATGEHAEPVSAETIARDHPDSAAVLREQGAAAERERIRSIYDQLAPHFLEHAGAVAPLMFDGTSTRTDAAVVLVRAMQAAQQQERAPAQPARHNVVAIETGARIH